MEPFSIGLGVAGIAATFGTAYFGPGSRWAVSRSEKSIPNEFLNYDVEFFSKFYRSEIEREPSMAYTHVADFRGGVPEVRFLKRHFRVSNRVSNEWKRQRDAAHRAWLESEQRTNEGRVVRLSFASKDLLKVSKTTYFEQGKSNLVLDYQQDAVGRSLRRILSEESDGSLPRLNDVRLANTVGLATTLYYSHKDSLVPYLTYRAPGQAYLPHGGVHCTASCVTPCLQFVNTPTFRQVFVDPMLRNILRVTGVTEGDLGASGLFPIALAREWTRAGKPQMFFAGYVNLSRSELKRRRKEAVKDQGNRPDILSKSATRIELQSHDAIVQEGANFEMSTECLASITYGECGWVQDTLKLEITG